MRLTSDTRNQSISCVLKCKDAFLIELRLLPWWLVSMASFVKWSFQVSEVEVDVDIDAILLLSNVYTFHHASNRIPKTEFAEIPTSLLLAPSEPTHLSSTGNSGYFACGLLPWTLHLSTIVPVGTVPWLVAQPHAPALRSKPIPSSLCACTCKNEENKNILPRESPIYSYFLNKYCSFSGPF